MAAVLATAVLASMVTSQMVVVVSHVGVTAVAALMVLVDTLTQALVAVMVACSVIVSQSFHMVVVSICQMMSVR